MHIFAFFYQNNKQKEVIYIKTQLKSRVLRWGIYSLCIVLLMCASFLISYGVVKNSAPPKNSESAPDVQNESFNSDKPFPNLPVTISGTYEENENFIGDTNDYLVIAENNLVNLYAIDKDENITFERILEIDIAALKKEDQDLLKKGIILNDKSAVLSLIEDYSS